jgi:hypothetical protein
MKIPAIKISDLYTFKLEKFDLFRRKIYQFKIFIFRQIIGSFVHLFREFGRTRDGACRRNNTSFCEEGVSHSKKEFLIFCCCVDDKRFKACIEYPSFCSLQYILQILVVFLQAWFEKVQ